MEHRHHVRIPVMFDMLIYRRGLPVATGRSRDASRGGLFVVTEYAELHEYQSLELEFRLDAAAEGARQRLNARVLRCAIDGLALEIDEADRGAVRAIGSLLGPGAAAGAAMACAEAGTPAMPVVRAAS